VIAELPVSAQAPASSWPWCAKHWGSKINTRISLLKRVDNALTTGICLQPGSPSLKHCPLNTPPVRGTPLAE